MSEIKKKFLLFTGNHNKEGIADYVEVLKQKSKIYNFELTISNTLSNQYDGIFFIENFIEFSVMNNLNNFLKKYKGKKILICTEFINLKKNTFNSFSKKTGLKFLDTGNKFFIYAISIFSYIFIYGLEQFFYSIASVLNSIKSLFLTTLGGIFYVFISFFLKFIGKILMEISIGILQIINQLLQIFFSTLIAFFILFAYFLRFLKGIILSILDIIIFTINFTLYPINIITRLFQLIWILFKKVLQIKFESFDISSDTSISSLKAKEIKDFILSNFPDLPDRLIILKIKLFNRMRVRILRQVILDAKKKGINFNTKYLKNFNLFKKTFKLNFLEKISVKWQNSEIKEELQMKGRYLSFRILIDSFDFIFSSHDEIKIPFTKKNIHRLYFIPDEKINFDKTKKITLSFSGVINTYRYEALNHLCKNLDNINFDKSEILNILQNKKKRFISSNMNSKNICSIHIQKSENWNFSSPTRYFNSIRKNEIPIILNSEFNDIESKMLTIDKSFLKVNDYKDIDRYLIDLNHKISKFKIIASNKEKNSFKLILES